jgi:P4 family phage/plasmid primase-like protien
VSAPERGPAGTWQHLAFWADGAMALSTTQANLPVDDLTATALLMSERHGGLMFARATSTWYIWDGRAWLPDTSGEIEKIVIHLAIRMKQMLAEARGAVLSSVQLRMGDEAKPAQVTDQQNKAWAEWAGAGKYAAGLAKSAGRTSLVNYLAAQFGADETAVAERNPGLLNLANGTLNLATGELLPFRREDMITYVLPVAWNPKAACPRFWKMLYRMCGDDYEVACYVVKLLGYCLLGDNREQKIIFINGPTGSGKSQILHIVSQVLGSLAHASQSELITLVRHGRNARTENSIRGKRLVTITETSQFMNIDEAQLKRLTGEPWISVNQHYAKAEIATPVTWGIWVATNQMPTLVNFDAAMRRRVIVIPGGPTIPEWQVDTSLATGILSAEREGILALLVRGCAEYFRSGLAMPDAVREETERYAAEQNTIANFIGDTMAMDGWSASGGIPVSDAWRAYEQWSKGSSRLGRNEFYEQMAKFPGITRNLSMRRFEGVAWNTEWAIRVS